MTPSCWFMIFALAWWLPQMLTVAVAEKQGEDCSSKTCGNLTISDPFWLVDIETGSSCGSPDFEVACYNNTPVLWSYGAFGFVIINITYEERSLRVIDQGKLELLHASNSCYALPLWNTSAKLGRLFRIDPGNLDLIFYNCTEEAAAAARQDGALVETRVRCRGENEMFFRAAGSYDETSNYAAYAVKGCHAIVMPVLGSSGEANASDYEQLISDGFLLTWDPSPPPPLARSKRTFTKMMLIVSISAAATLLFPCIYFLIWHRKGKRLWFLLCKKASSNTEKNYEAMVVSYGPLAPKRYMYSEVMKITSSRSDQLGKGGYGVVFKGRLHDGRLVAVKFLHDCKGNGNEFVNEVIKNPKEILGWERLYAIATGIARGLEYLHHSCNTRIVHFDIKPQNILLDKDFIPKIADFGLGKLSHAKESKVSMTGARGTIGFIAPEVHSQTFGVVSTKSDVYSYGMMLLEMVGGRRNVKSVVEKSSERYFPDWIYDHLAQEDGLQACEVTGEIEEVARKMVLIGLWCIQVLPVYRPTITEVLEMFERSLDDLDMPPKQNFRELLENSSHNMDMQSASCTISGETSHGNSIILQ
ncbi:hypothetical protein ACQ4PT_011261 [Festuca glaucescens]